MMLCGTRAHLITLLLDRHATTMLYVLSLWRFTPIVAKVMREPNPIEAFIATWRDTGGSELANTQSFVNGLCAILGVSPPSGSRTDDALNDYVFERRVFQDNG